MSIFCRASMKLKQSLGVIPKSVVENVQEIQSYTEKILRRIRNIPNLTKQQHNLILLSYFFLNVSYFGVHNVHINNSKNLCKLIFLILSILL